MQDEGDHGGSLETSRAEVEREMKRDTLPPTL